MCKAWYWPPYMLTIGIETGFYFGGSFVRLDKDYWFFTVGVGPFYIDFTYRAGFENE